MAIFRSKIKTPWCDANKIYMGNYCDFDPKQFPNLFEEVREKSNQEKWESIMVELGICTKEKAQQFSKFLDANGHDCKDCFLKVLTDNEKYTKV